MYLLSNVAGVWLELIRLSQIMAVLAQVENFIFSKCYTGFYLINIGIICFAAHVVTLYIDIISILYVRV